MFFCTDIHGSTRCWNKVVKARKFYKADVVIVGGDITGKAIVPIVHQSDGTFTSSFLGRKWTLKNRQELQAHEALIADSGLYAYSTEAGQMEDLGEKKVAETIFKEKITERLKEWSEIAQTEFKATGKRIIVCPGNDDYEFIDEVLQKSDVLVNSEGKILDLDADHEMLSCGWSNPTPWHTPRECSEEELAKKIETMVAKIRDLQSSVFNLHDPPFGSGLDVAPKLKNGLQVSARGETEHVGSKAVLDLIQRYQPLLSLHGHIHEAMGMHKIGKTLCINPGSNYTDGILSGVLVAIEKKEIKSTLLTSG